MNIDDELFHDEYKPLVVPAHFSANDSMRNQVIYALSTLGAGTAAEVGTRLYELDDQTPKAELQKTTHEILSSLFDKGLLKGSKNEQGQMEYNLSKITETNTGEPTDADQR
ncbi:hypothetical protein GCM10027037_14930 [Mucilaginibacter koreensis]